MTILAAVTGFAVALVLVLGWMVLTLRRDVAALTAQADPGATGRKAASCRGAGSRARAACGDHRSPLSGPWCPWTAATTKTEAEPTPVEDVPVITALADEVDDVDLTTRRVASVTLARPLIKIAALSFGVRRALDDESRMRVRLTMRRELKRQRKMRRRRRAGRAPSQGWVP